MSLQENRAAYSLPQLEELQDHQIHQLPKEEQHAQNARQDQNQNLQLDTLNENQEQEEHEEHKDRMNEEPVRHELYGEISEAPTSEQNNLEQEHGLQGNIKQQSLAPQLSIRSRKPVVSDSTCPTSENHVPRNIAVSNASTISAHPHRSEEEVRVVNNPPQPVELAITADDSSEEIVMSPTSYPGQEWTPMHL